MQGIIFEKFKTNTNFIYLVRQTIIISWVWLGRDKIYKVKSEKALILFHKEKICVWKKMTLSP